MIARVAAVLVGLASVAVACSGPQGDSKVGEPGAGEAESGQTAGGAAQAGAARSGGGSLSNVPKAPTLEECRAQPIPEGQSCQWALVQYPWCGGVQPPFGANLPRCSCEACGVDADCPGGSRCGTLSTDEMCHPPKMLCLGPKSECDEKGGCKDGEWCMWIDGKATCKVPTMHPVPP